MGSDAKVRGELGHGLVVGIDGGGTRGRALLQDARGEGLARIEGPGLNPGRCGVEGFEERLGRLLSELLEDTASNASVVGVGLGLAGLSRPGAAEAAARLFAAHLPAAEVALFGDGDAAHAAAFGAQGTGLLVMAGTGSGAQARGPRGAICTGGYGPDWGDEASGTALGRAALRHLIAVQEEVVGDDALARRLRAALELEDGGDLRTALAACEASTLAPLVVAASSRCPSAAGIVEREAARLALSAAAAVRKAGLDPVAAVAFTGGVALNAPGLRDQLLKRLKALGVATQGAEECLVPDAARGAAAIVRAQLAS